MDTRIGYPNEHLANDVQEDLASPMYATGIGLVIEGMERFASSKENLPVGKQVEPEEETDTDTEVKDAKPSSFLRKIQDFFEKDEM